MPKYKLSHIPASALKNELMRRLERVKVLMARREEIDREITAISAFELPSFKAMTAEAHHKPGRRTVAKPGRRPGRKPKAKRATGKPLAQYVQEMLALAPKGLSVKIIEKQVLAAGYPTRAKTIYNQVATVLAKGGFKKVARGVYAVAKRPGRKPGKKAETPVPEER